LNICRFWLFNHCT